MRVIEEALERVKDLVPNLAEIKVAQVVLGLGYTGVKLSDGHAGLCYTFQAEICGNRSTLPSLGFCWNIGG